MIMDFGLKTHAFSSLRLQLENKKTMMMNWAKYLKSVKFLFLFETKVKSFLSKGK